MAPRVAVNHKSSRHMEVVLVMRFVMTRIVEFVVVHSLQHCCCCRPDRPVHEVLVTCSLIVSCFGGFDNTVNKAVPSCLDLLTRQPWQVTSTSWRTISQYDPTHTAAIDYCRFHHKLAVVTIGHCNVHKAR